MKPFLFLLLAFIGCVSRSAETSTTDADSLTVASDSGAMNTQAASGPVVTPLATVVDRSLADSLKNHPLAIYHGEYRLNSSAAAEQARMIIMFEGNRTFSYYISYNVADFCSDEARGTFTRDDNNVGRDPAEPVADENRSSYLTGQLMFTFADGRIQVSDGINTFGVGVCNLSGEFLRCDGPCPEIKSEDYGIEETESDSI